MTATRTKLCASIALSLASITLVGCQACDACSTKTDNGAQAVVGNEFTDKAVLGRLSMLDGDWQFIDEAGNDVEGLTCSFDFSSNNSVVREIMFPGGDGEMTNLYHLDGEKIICTHYCAAGNQPRMVASGIQTDHNGTSIDFKLESISNLRPEHDHYMGGLKLVFTDDDTLEQHWTNLTQNGEVAGEVVFIMKRVQVN